MYYIKRKHTGKYFIVTEEKIYEIDMQTKTETIKNNTPRRKRMFTKDTIKYELLTRSMFIKQMKKAKFEMSSSIQNLINVQLKLIFDYKLF